MKNNCKALYEAKINLLRQILDELLLVKQETTFAKQLLQRKHSLEATTRDALYFKKVFLEIVQNSQETPGAWTLFKKETLAQVFSCEYCEISRNTFFTENLWTTASKNWNYDNFGESTAFILRTLLTWVYYPFPEIFILKELWSYTSIYVISSR